MNEYFYIMEPGPHFELTSRRHLKYLPHYGRIRHLGGWQGAGFNVPIDSDGRVKPKNTVRCVYQFQRVLVPSQAHLEAIATGKRFALGANDILEYLRVGVPFDDFIVQPRHVSDYCLGVLAEEKGQSHLALAAYKRAAAGDPGNYLYIDRLYRLRISNGDSTAIWEEVKSFSSDIAGRFHSGRVDEWFKLLLAKKEYAATAVLIQIIWAAFNRESFAEINDSRYWALHKWEEFEKKVERWRNSSRYAPVIKELDERGGLPPRKGLQDMNKELLFTYFTKHCGEEWHASQPVPLSAWESVEALWPLNGYFRRHYKEFRALPYLSACEQQADKALTKFAFEGEWGLLSLETWRVLLERQQQAIMALPLHEASGGRPMVFIPPMLPKSARTGAVVLVLLHSMKLPFPVGDRAAFEPDQSPPR